MMPKGGAVCDLGVGQDSQFLLAKEYGFGVYTVELLERSRGKP